MSGITPEGFDRKRLDEILSDMRLGFKAIFGDNLNVSPESSDGQVIGVAAAAFAQLWEVAEGSYNAFNPSIAKDAALTNLVQLNGIFRLAASPSIVGVQLSGLENTVIPAGSLVSADDSSSTFSTDVDAVIPSALAVNVPATCTVTGPTIAAAGTLTVIDTPITGWVSVTNPTDAVLGEDEESDSELRARRVRSVARDAQAIIDAIFAAVVNVPGVTQAVVLENDTNVTDVSGLPPHSFQVVVVGGSDEDIGNAIWLKKPAGILSFGTTTIPIIDSQGIPHDISFSRPTVIDIYVEVDVTTFPSYPADGDDQMKQAIVDYANGNLVPGRGFSLGGDVIYTRLYTPINSVPGHEIDALRIGTSLSPTGTSNIPISITEISNFLVDNIVVTS